MGVTVEEVVADVIEAIGEVTGSGVQVYSEDRILKETIRTFDFIFIKYPWEAYKKWLTLELDGTTGVADDDLGVTIRGLHDVLAVYREGSANQMPMLPEHDNPYLITGTQPRYFTALASDHAQAEARLLQFWPLTAEGNVHVKFRLYPTVFLPSTVLFVDRTLLVEGTAWSVLADEGLNSESTAKHRELFDMRFADIMKSISNHPHPGAVTGGNIPVEWR
jgi:hypothetical protein